MTEVNITNNQQEQKEVKRIDLNVVIASQEQCKKDLSQVVGELGEDFIAVVVNDATVENDFDVAAALRENYKGKYDEILELSFSDSNIVSTFTHPKIVPFTEQEAGLIIHLVFRKYNELQNSKDKDTLNLLITCKSGFTASAAIAAGICFLLDKLDSTSNILSAGRPNSWVFSTIIKVGVEYLQAVKQKWILGQVYKPVSDILLEIANKTSRDIINKMKNNTNNETSKETK